jgi:hypothetical protein
MKTHAGIKFNHYLNKLRIIMKITTVLILLCSMFSFQSFAQEWGTVFPTDKEIAAIDKTYSGKKIIVQNHYYPKAGKFDEVLALRIAASKLRKEFGFSAGRVIVTRQTLDRANGKQEEVAAVTWHSEYESLGALKKELSSFTAEQESRQKKILNKMSLLINRFRRTSSYVVLE